MDTFFRLSSWLISEKQYPEHRSQKSETRNRARGEKTKPEKDEEDIGNKPIAAGGAETPFIIVPGAAAQGAIDLFSFIPGICPFPNIAA